VAEGVDIRPSIAITKARLTLPEISDAIDAGRLKIDGAVVHESRDVAVTKAALDPVWYLPGIAERFEVDETTLRRTLFEQTGGMYPELVTGRTSRSSCPDRRHHPVHLRRPGSDRRPGAAPDLPRA